MNIEDITKWLEQYNINDFIVLPHKYYGFIVNVYDDVSLNDKGLTEIGVQFDVIHGSFTCSNNLLTSLKGAPRIVDGHFNCCNNKIESLQYGPEKVGRSYYCFGNSLTNLEFSPSIVENFDCGHNMLNTLYGAPNTVRGDFRCNNNFLTSLEHCPSLVGDLFVARHNDIANLVYMPESTGGYFSLDDNPRLLDVQKVRDFEELLEIKKSHIEIEKIKAEQKNLHYNLLESTKSAVHKI